MKKKIMVHCSTNGGSSNFGDVLFAKMILGYLLDKGYEVAFYDLSTYFRDYLYKQQGFPEYKFNLKEADAALYFGGGYFGERKCESIFQHIYHYRRFMQYGKKILDYNIKTAVIGIGAGNYLWGPSATVVKKICEKALYVSTRDCESTEFLNRIGVSRYIETCSDIAQTINKKELNITERMSLNPKRKYIYLHIGYQMDIAQLFAKGIKPFLDKNPNVDVILGADSVLKIDKTTAYIQDYLGHNRTIFYNYTTPDNLCWILSQCNLVITYKLHVGILTAALSKSVIAFPKHEKVKRYYHQIGEPDRILDFESTSPQDITRMAEKFLDKNLILNNHIRELAQKNWVVLNKFLKQI